MMKRFTPLAAALIVAFPAHAATAVPPSEVVVTPGQGVTVTTTRRATNTSKTISLTVNKQDAVRVVGPAASAPPVVVTPPPVIKDPPPVVLPPPIPVPPVEPPVTNHHGGIFVDDKDLPVGPPGVNVELFAPSPVGPQTMDQRSEGAFRTACNFSGFDNNDGIVYPGQKDLAHKHIRFRPGTDENLTAATVRRGRYPFSSCRGGSADLSDRWLPAMIDTTTSKPLLPIMGLLIYYKTGIQPWTADYITNPIRPLPPGLVMISGSSTNDKPEGVGSENGFTCMSADGNSTWRAGTAGPSIPKCNPGDAVRMYVEFPQCWDGKNLDSPNHKSHMARPIEWWADIEWTRDRRPPPAEGSYYRCPSTHPVPLPLITFFVDYLVKPGVDSSKWRLSSDVYDPALPGGYSVHADWLNGWDPKISDVWGEKCLNQRRNCGSYNVGDGRGALEFQGN